MNRAHENITTTSTSTSCGLDCLRDSRVRLHARSLIELASGPLLVLGAGLDHDVVAVEKELAPAHTRTASNHLTRAFLKASATWRQGRASDTAQITHALDMRSSARVVKGPRA
jgi:hypothetical protein